MTQDHIVEIVVAFIVTIPSIIAALQAKQAVRVGQDNAEKIAAVHETVNGSGILVAAVKKSTDEALAQHDVETEALLHTIKQGVAETLAEKLPEVTK